MNVHITTGTSFKGAGLYLLHDKLEPGEAARTTANRVPWTHALNTLEDEPWQVIAEMQQTCLNQSALKLESGNRLDGRPTEKPVMHVSLAWSPDQPQPNPAGMIAAAQDYLKDRGWDELQCLLVPHTDAGHAHVHLLINRVHPDTGMAADQSYRNHNAVLWARKYDAEQGFFLDRREAKYARGEKIGKDMTRAEWEAWKASGGTARPGRQERAAEQKSGEWDALKAAQRDERMAFFKESATQRAELREGVRSEVKAAFADQWQEYAAYRDHRQQQQRRQDQETRRQLTHWRKLGGMESVAKLEQRRAAQHAVLREDLAEVRGATLAAQNARIKELAEPALAQHAIERAAAYEGVKASHRDEKKELHRDQAAGTPRADLVQRQQEAADRLAAARRAGLPVQPPQRDQATPPGQACRVSFRPHGARQFEAVRRYYAHGVSPAPVRPAPANSNPPPRVDEQARAAAARQLARQRTADRERGDDGGRDRDR